MCIYVIDLFYWSVWVILNLRKLYKNFYLLWCVIMIFFDGFYLFDMIFFYFYGGKIK